MLIRGFRPVEHNNMIRGLVTKEKLLEWSVEDRCEPLCTFLGKEVPVEEFPHANMQSGFKGRMDGMMNLWARKSMRNMMRSRSLLEEALLHTSLARQPETLELGACYLTLISILDSVFA